MICEYTRRLQWSVILTILLGLAAVGPSYSSDLPDTELAPISEPAVDEWEANLAVYGWLTGIEGTVGALGLPPVDVDADFSDIWDVLDMALFVAGEVRRDRFGIFGDFIYADLSTSGSGPVGLLTLKADTQLYVGTAMAEYRVVESGNTSVDLMAGARLWRVDLGVQCTSGFCAGTSVSDSETWADPMIGAKARFQGDSPWYMTAWGMVGGFGVSSDIQWDLLGVGGYQFNDTFSLIAGYRATGVDYKDGSFIFDVVVSGPVVGGVIKF